MPRQYTFKTTRRTTYLEEVLNNVDGHDRSAFIREMLTLGLQTAGYLDGVVQKSYFDGVVPTKVSLLSDESIKKVTPKQVQDNTKVTQDEPTVEAPDTDGDMFDEVETDLEDALGSLDFDNMDIGGIKNDI